MSFLKKSGDPRFLALPFLAGATVSAYGAGNYLSWTGIAYYIFCAAAMVKNHQKASLFLWAAVGAHLLLTGYSLWSWRLEGVIPCAYCLAAAGFVLVAATIMCKPPLAVLPALLMVAVWYAWPWILAGGPEVGNKQAGSEILIQSPGLQQEKPEPSSSPEARQPEPDLELTLQETHVPEKLPGKEENPPSAPQNSLITGSTMAGSSGGENRQNSQAATVEAAPAENVQHELKAAIQPDVTPEEANPGIKEPEFQKNVPDNSKAGVKPKSG